MFDPRAHLRAGLVGGLLTRRERLAPAAALMDYPQVVYDSQADLLYKLAGQMIDYLRSYLTSEEDVENVALAHGKILAQRIFSQMKAHYRQTSAEYRASEVRSFRALQPQQFSYSLAKLLPMSQAARRFVDHMRIQLKKRGRRLPKRLL